MIILELVFYSLIGLWVYMAALFIAIHFLVEKLETTVFVFVTVTYIIYLILLWNGEIV